MFPWGWELEGLIRDIFLKKPAPPHRRGWGISIASKELGSQVVKVREYFA
jgi:hypothetical protein